MTLPIRTRLLAGTVAGTTIVLLAAGMLLYQQIEAQFQHEFDRTLAAKASVLASLVEQDKGKFEFEFDGRVMPEFAPGDRAEYFQIWGPDGQTLARSPSLDNDASESPVPSGSQRVKGAFQPPKDSFQSPQFAELTLPNGQKGRLVTIAALARVESPRISGPAQRIIVTYARSTADFSVALQKVFWLMIWVGLVAVAVSAILLLVGVSTGLRPLNQLAKRIADLRPDEPAARITLQTPRELTPVVDQMNSLLHRVETVIQREKSFSADVAHELRTPLAGLRSTLEVSLGRTRDTHEYCDAMGECLKITTQMQTIVNNLLYLAKLDAGGLPCSKNPVQLNSLLSECWHPFAETARQKLVVVNWNGSSIPEIASDTNRLRQVFTNLFENAVEYVDSAGAIEVTTQPCAHCIKVTISNTGSQLAKEDAPRTLDRFWRGDAGRHHTGVHCGLGLPLAKKLIENLGGTIEVASEKNAAFRVTVTFPSQTRLGRTTEQTCCDAALET